jgi:hypothetical protein
MVSHLIKYPAPPFFNVGVGSTMAATRILRFITDNAYCMLLVKTTLEFAGT